MIKKYIAGIYARTVKDSRKFLYSLFEKNKNAKLLDCGCWDGTNSKVYGEKIGSKKLYGLEIEKSKCIEVKKKGIISKQADLNKRLPFKDNSFDVITAYHVIEHLVNVEKFVDESYRILKKKGYMIIGTPNLASWHNIFALILGLQPFSGPSISTKSKASINLVQEINKKRTSECGYQGESFAHIKVMTAKTLKKLLISKGFKIEKIRGFGYHPLPYPFSSILSRIDPWHSHYCVIKVRK